MWLSSVDEHNRTRLEELQCAMQQYYSSSAIRATYNQLIPVKEEKGSDNPVTTVFLEWLKKQHCESLLEVGCGNGRILKKLEENFKGFKYTGIEVDTKTIERNKQRWPTHEWHVGSVYEIPISKGSIDLCMSFYVLEHLVFPKEALNQMFQTLKPGGKLLIVCPDFSVTKRFPSQNLGNSAERSTKRLLKKMKLLTAFNFYIDNMKMKRKLDKLKGSPGKFLVNSFPICLYYLEKVVWPDIDAVYVATKYELEFWAKSNNAKFSYPFGVSPPFDEHIFMVIERPSD
ncbi:hypothetical protein BH10BAC3_BH10BAC3_33910 [soil metagenome]